MKKINHNQVYMFDVDGVLCEIGSPEMSNEVMHLVAKMLDEGAHVAVNTGRGYDRIGGELLKPLRNYISSVQSLNNLFISTEMGGELTDFENGNERTRVGEYSLTTSQMDKAQKIYEINPHMSSTMERYASKKSMFTLVKIRGSDDDMFHEQLNFMHNLFLDHFEDDKTVTIALTAESLDVYMHKAGKYAGAQSALEWISRKTDIKYDDFVCFGDSHNDYEMARFFAHQGMNVRFIYTGKVPLRVNKTEKAVIVMSTSQPYTRGTLEYLTKIIAQNEK